MPTSRPRTTDASADYVAGRLEAAGYDVSLQEFAFPFFQDLGTTLTQESPNPTAYETVRSPTLPTPTSPARSSRSTW